MDKNNKKLTIKRQCELLELNRTSIYYTPRPKDQSEEYRIKWLIDEIYTAHPEYGYRRITVVLNQEYSIIINRKRTQKYMREMGIQGIHPGPNLSKQGKAKYIHPYLLRNLTINTPNHVWSIDITYIRLPKGFLYMAAIIDWHSRLLLHYEVSNTMDKGLIQRVVKAAIQKHGKPKIINSDQGSQFTCPDYIDLLKSEGITISMDGKGRATDNIRIERFWRSLKYEKLYLSEYSTPREVKALIKEYICHYNEYRPHQSLNYQKPINVHYTNTVYQPAC